MVPRVGLAWTRARGGRNEIGKGGEGNLTLRRSTYVMFHVSIGIVVQPGAEWELRLVDVDACRSAAYSLFAYSQVQYPALKATSLQSNNNIPHRDCGNTFCYMHPKCPSP